MPNPPESFAGLELPRFADRLPDLVQALRQSGAELEGSRPQQTYLPYWEDIHAVAHSLKGVLQILACPPALVDFILQLNDSFREGLTGPAVCRRNREAGAALQQLASLLDTPEPADLTPPPLAAWLAEFNSLYEIDQPHEARVKSVPSHLFYVNDFVSKKAREIELLHLNHCVVEDMILLDEIPLWRTQLNEALYSADFGRGIVVNFLPFLSSEGSRQLKIWAWVAAASHSRAALKQRIKEVIPKAQITKL